MVKPSDDLSIDVDAALASAAPASTPATSNASPSDDDTGADEAPDSEPDFFADEQDQDEAPEAEDTEESAEADDDEIEVTSYGKVHKVKLSDKENLKRLLSLGLSAPKAFNKAAKLSQENKKLQKDLDSAKTDREKAKIWDKLEAVKDDENELFRLITGGKRTLDDVVEDRIKRKRAFEDASPAEQVKMLADEREKMLLKELDRMKATSTMERQESERLAEEASQKSAHAVAYPEFQSVLKALDVKDPVERQEVATDLWELAWARVGRYVDAYKKEHGEEPELTAALMKKNFETVAKRFGYVAKQQTKAKVKQILDKKSKDATRRAGLAATKNYKTSDFADLQNLSPTKAFEKLFARK